MPKAEPRNPDAAIIVRYAAWSGREIQPRRHKDTKEIERGERDTAESSPLCLGVLM